jgi:hypothetical protein
VRERPVASGVVEVPVPVGATVRKDVVVSPVTRGIFSALYGVHDGAFPEGELGYCVLPKPPQAMPRHALASNMDNLDAAYALMAAMGHKWQLYCKLRAEWPNNLNPSPDRWNMDEARRVIAGPAKHGMKTMPCLWPTRVPKHLEDAARSPVDALADGRRDVTRAGRGGKIPPYPDVAKWSAYCRSVAEALADVAPWWTLEDETEGHYTPREFAPIVRATAEGFAASGKPVSLSLSCTPDYTEELIAELGDRPAFQGIGGSSYNMEYWDAAKIRGLQKRLKMDWHCIGVGQDSQPQMKHSFPGYASVYASAARTAREMVLLCLAQDAKVLGHYTGRLSAREGLYNVDFPLMDYDGAPLPHGFSYSCIPLLLANAEPVEDVYVEALDLLIFAYRQDGRLGAVTWAGNTPNLDIHWKVWPRDLRRFAIAGDVDVRDMYGNRRDDARLQDGRTVFDLGEEPVFVLNKGMADAAFLDSLRRATSAPPEVETRLAFLPDGKGGMDLGVWARNHTGRPLVGLKLDANFPDQRMVTLTGWLFPDRTGVMPDLAPGAAAFGRIPTAHRPAFPVENATITVWLTADGREHPWYERCWMMPAPRLAVNVDGRIDEWSRVQPAWLWNSFSWGRYGRSFPQIVAGAENIKHVYRLDGRAAVWTAWDDTRLYVAFRCEDDVFVFTGPRERRDHFALRFDCDLMGDFGPQASTPDVEVAVLPTGDGVQVSGCEGARAAMSVEGRAWTVEVALPIRAVMARAPAAGEALGFDLVWTDADPEGGEVAVSRMRWAGGSRTLGQVFLTQ